MKYGIWNVAKAERRGLDRLEQAGYSPLVARLLCSRGYTEPETAAQLLSPGRVLYDPLEMQGMAAAAGRIRQALRQGEHVAVYGDYDVDGITATCLLTEFLRSQGCRVSYYIPGRMEEGYGLNRQAILQLKSKGVTLIVTVDCGITAGAEAQFCRLQGIDLIITDHHECKKTLPDAVAVVDPHRKDDTYPHRNLAGVGVAFKLAAAIIGSQEAILERFSDLLCLGTVADVMPLTGENRIFVTNGLRVMNREPRPGVAALMAECGCSGKTLTASVIGYTLAPRINAAGRMSRVDLATELILTEDPDRAAELARTLCQLNRQRQEVEGEIYREAVSMLERQPQKNAIVLAGENWHQGVVGIVASRLAEEYGCPAYLICLEGQRGKASSRSYGGFNLFASLEQLSALLESYGGHELAAGFTIDRENIACFGQEIHRLADEFVASGRQRAALELDCDVGPELLTEENIRDLDRLEPCGAGCPKPLFFMDRLEVEQLSEIGGGKHLRLRLGRDGFSFGTIFFSTTALQSAIGVGDRVEIAFTPQINEFRGSRTVQLNLTDIRPDSDSRASTVREEALVARFFRGAALTTGEAAQLLPDRREFAAVWRYLAANVQEGKLQEELSCLSRKLSRSGPPVGPGRLWICLQVFRERGLLACSDHRGYLRIELCPGSAKVDLEQSPILMQLNRQKAGA